MKGWLEALLRALPCPSFTISQFFFWFSRFMKMRYWAWSSWMPFFLEAKPSKYIYTDCAWNKCILFREKKNLIRGRSLSKLFLIWATFFQIYLYIVVWNLPYIPLVICVSAPTNSITLSFSYPQCFQSSFGFQVHWGYPLAPFSEK